MNLEIDQMKKVFSIKNFSIEIIRYNAMGEIINVTDPSYLTLYMIRMQQKNITINDGADNLGSILYADSFFETSGQSLNITKHVPNLLSFYTTHQHYEHCSIDWNLSKNMK